MNSNNIFIGVDPGQHGGFAVLGPYGLDVWDLKHAYGKTTGFNSLDPLKFSEMIDSAIFNGCNNVKVYIEDSLILPRDGAKTSRSVYESRGVMFTVFTLRGLDVNFVPPVVWKRRFGLLKKDKKASVELVIKLLPDYTDFFQKQYRGRTVLLDGRAEATLLALFGQQTN